LEVITESFDFYQQHTASENEGSGKSISLVLLLLQIKSERSSSEEALAASL